MLTVILIMTAGVFLGYFLRSKKNFLHFSTKSTRLIIFVLLFFMGISVGSNRIVMNNIDTIGLRGLQLALVSIGGSVILSWIVYRFLFKSKDREA